MKRLVLAAVLSLSTLTPQVSQAQVRIAFPGVRVTVGPPALRYDVAPPAPSARHVWIAGYWGWRGNAHVWMPGHWARPPAPSYVWEPARWENVTGAWMFYDGHWRPTDQPDPEMAYQPPPPPVNEVVVPGTPPPPIDEVHPAPPFQGAVWIPGYWHWSHSASHYVWATGRWSPRPAGYRWEQQRWEHRHDGRWMNRPGHWQEDPDHHPGERRDEHHH